jgi:NOL1/NOP2/sun family putative RNA methylase
VNTLKARKADVESFLKSKSVAFEQVPWCPEGLWVDSSCNLDSVEHQLGYYYVQTSASMIPSVVLDPLPGESVLDLCAAPGSKTTHMAQLMQNSGVLVANEGSFVRVRSLVINVQRSGAANVVVTRRDGVGFERLGERFERVMLDAPCSDVGTARKDPRVLQSWSLDRIRRLSNLQKKLMVSAFGCLKPGGVLVYSTCTTSREENEDVVAHLLRQNSGAVLEDVRVPGLKTRRGLTEETRGCARIVPQDNDSDAYFIAKVRKNA